MHPMTRQRTMPPHEADAVSAVGTVVRRPDDGEQPTVVDGRRTVTRGLAGIVFARFAVNGGIRVVYPFLPVIARGLDVSLELIGVLLAARSVTGLAGPAIARFAAPHRRRDLMVFGQLLVVAGCGLIISSAAAAGALRIAVLGAGMLSTGLARPLFDLPMQTWISAHVPAGGRSRAIGITELAWALSFAVTVPVAGVLIERLGWRSPFVLVAGLATGGALAIVLKVPRDPIDGWRPPMPIPALRLRRAHGRRTPLAPAICVGVGLAVAASESLLVVYGQWLTDAFGMAVADIGTSILLIAAAELIGEGLVIAASNRVDPQRMVCGALLTSATAYIGLGVIGQRVGLALVAVGAVFVAFEVVVVASIALVSTGTLDRHDRTRLFGALMAAIACGNAVGAAVAPVLFARGSIVLSAAVSALATAAATVVLWFGARCRSQRAANAAETMYRYRARRIWFGQKGPPNAIRRHHDLHIEYDAHTAAAAAAGNGRNVRHVS